MRSLHTQPPRSKLGLHRCCSRVFRPSAIDSPLHLISAQPPMLLGDVLGASPASFGLAAILPVPSIHLIGCTAMWQRSSVPRGFVSGIGRGNRRRPPETGCKERATMVDFHRSGFEATAWSNSSRSTDRKLERRTCRDSTRRRPVLSACLVPSNWDGSVRAP